MIKSLLTKAALVLGLFGGGAVVMGADDHTHDKGPHGGIVAGFGDKFHMEAVRSGDKVSFYLLDGDGKSGATIAKHKGGTITLIIPGKGQKKTEIPAGGPFSEVSAPASGKGKITATVKLNVDGKTISGKFRLKDL